MKNELPKHTFDPDQTKDEEIRKGVSNTIENLGLFALYGLANSSFNQVKLEDVSKLLDPLVDRVIEGKMPEIKQNIQLGSALFGMALQANVQIGNIEKARKVVKALDYLSSGAEAAGTANVVLLQLNALIGDQIKELRKKGDKKSLDNSIAGFTAILDDVTKKQKINNDLIRLIAINYSTMGLNEKALTLLKTAVKPAMDNDAKANAAYKGIQLQIARELRTLKKFEEATKLVEEIVTGTKEIPGWGAKDAQCLLEKVKLLEAQEKYNQSVPLASQMVKQLVSKSSDNQIKDKYLEAYYHMVFGMYHYGVKASDPARKSKGISDAAGLIEKLETSQPDFGSAESKKRFDDLLASEKELKEQFEKLKAKRVAPASKTGAQNVGDKK